MKCLFCILAIFLCSPVVFSQNKTEKTTDKTANEQTSKFPLFDGLKPRIELPKALKRAEGLIKKEKINTANHYLSRVNLIQYGAPKDRQIVWYLRWVKTDGTIGDYIEIVVFMDGSVKRLPPLFK